MLAAMAVLMTRQSHYQHQQSMRHARPHVAEAEQSLFNDLGTGQSCFTLLKVNHTAQAACKHTCTPPGYMQGLLPWHSASNRSICPCLLGCHPGTGQRTAAPGTAHHHWGHSTGAGPCGLGQPLSRCRTTNQQQGTVTRAC